MLRPLIAMAVALGTTSTALAQPGPRPDQSAFRAIYKELVETNTTYSSGDCTLASQRMAKHLTDAGYPEQDVRVFVAEGHPKEGGLVAAAGQ